MTREDIIRIYKEANGWSPKGFENTVDELERFAALVMDAKRNDLLDTIDELIGMERDRHPMFSEGYDHALHHIAQFVQAKGGT